MDIYKEIERGGYIDREREKEMERTIERGGRMRYICMFIGQLENILSSMET